MSNNRTVDDINVGIQIAAEAHVDHEERYGEAKRLYEKAVHYYCRPLEMLIYLHSNGRIWENVLINTEFDFKI